MSINLNRSTIEIVVTPGSIPSNNVFPPNPVDGQEVVRSDLQFSKWRWVPDAGTNGEWWSDKQYEHISNVSVTANGNGLRTAGAIVMNNAEGIPLDRRYRILSVQMSTAAAENGDFEFRISGVSGARQANYSDSGANTLFSLFTCPTNNDDWLIGDLSGSDQNLSIHWVNSTTGSATRPVSGWHFVEVRLQGE